MLSSTPVPVFDGKAENFASYQQEVDLWTTITQVPMNRRAPALALAMDKIPREVCLALGNDVLKSDLGVDKIMDALHKDIAPDAHDSAFRDVVAFFGARRSPEKTTTSRNAESWASGAIYGCSASISFSTLTSDFNTLFPNPRHTSRGILSIAGAKAGALRFIGNWVIIIHNSTSCLKDAKFPAFPSKTGTGEDESISRVTQNKIPKTERRNCTP